MNQPLLFPNRPKRKPLRNTNLNSGERTLAWLRKQGYEVDICQRWLPIFERRRRREEVGRCSACGAAVLVSIENDKPQYVRGVRKDLFGLADMVAYEFGRPAVVLVQSTSKPEIAEHLRQYRNDAEKRRLLLGWLARPGRKFLIVGWQRYEVPAKKGGCKRQWIATERWVTAEDLVEPEF